MECCLKNHYYTFNGNLMRQHDGGAIGSDLTGKLTRVTMVGRDMRLLNLIKELELVINLHS